MKLRCQLLSIPLTLLLLFGGSGSGPLAFSEGQALAQPSAAAPAGKDSRPTVAVLYFDYDGPSEELAALRKGLTQMLVTNLSASNRYPVVERQRMDALSDELYLDRKLKLDSQSVGRLGHLLGARLRGSWPGNTSAAGDDSLSTTEKRLTRRSPACTIGQRFPAITPTGGSHGRQVRAKQVKQWSVLLQPQGQQR